MLLDPKNRNSEVDDWPTILLLSEDQVDEPRLQGSETHPEEGEKEKRMVVRPGYLSLVCPRRLWVECWVVEEFPRTPP